MTKTVHVVIGFFFLTCSLNSIVWGQSFTKVTTGPIVNDGGSSWGCSWADFNGDGFLDLLVTRVGQSLLYVGRGDTVFTKIDTGDVVLQTAEKRGSTWGDYDRDGDLDLFIANANGTNFLYRNAGNGFLERITSGVVVNDTTTGRGCAWVDYDNDGRLDLYVNTTAGNRLYHNSGNGTFTRITSGSIVTDVAQSIGCAWGDYNNDGYQDLFVANFGQNNNLYKNNGDGTFTKMISGNIVNEGGPSSGTVWGDYDNDGDLDLFVSRNQNQKDFFYRNDGPPAFTFTKDTTSVIANDAGDSYAGSWVDYDIDGDLDLFVCNRAGQTAFLYRNGGPPTYTFARIDTGIVVTDIGNQYGSAWGDFDNDGDPDLFVCNQGGLNNFLYRNNASGNNWIRIRCVGTVSNSTAIGVRVKVKATIAGSPRWQMREISSQSGYYSQNSLDVHFGLGNAAIIDSIVIEWTTPSGNRSAYTSVAVNQFVTYTQTSTGVEGEDETQPAAFALFQNYPNPFNPVTEIRYQISEVSHVTLKVYDVLGMEVRTLVNERLQPGSYEATFDASGLASGVYLYRLQAGRFIQTRKLMLLR